jgi:hypothetical protein
LDLIGALKKVAHATRISFSEQPARIFKPVPSPLPKREFDWVPLLAVDEEISDFVKNINVKNISRLEKIRRKAKELFFSGPTVIGIELFGIFDAVGESTA